MKLEKTCIDWVVYSIQHTDFEAEAVQKAVSAESGTLTQEERYAMIKSVLENQICRFFDGKESFDLDQAVFYVYNNIFGVPEVRCVYMRNHKVFPVSQSSLFIRHEISQKEVVSALSQILHRPAVFIDGHYRI